MDDNNTAGVSSVTLPARFLNAYAITNIDEIRIPVRTYSVQSVQSGESKLDRSAVKGFGWDLFREYRSRCAGPRFVIDVNDRVLAVPAGWQLPSGARIAGLEAVLEDEFLVNPFDPNHHRIMEGLVREGVKQHFKNCHCRHLGPLWTDFDKFCQMPDLQRDEDFLMCRRFQATTKILRGGVWAVEFVVNTTTLDGRTLADYLRMGDGQLLASTVDAKLEGRVTRDNKQFAVRLWHGGSSSSPYPKVVELEDPVALLRTRSLSTAEQQYDAHGTVRCIQFGKGKLELPLSELRLILDTSSTQAEHRESIMEPHERFSLIEALRDFSNGADIFGHSLALSDTPIDLHQIGKAESIALPALRVANSGGKETIIPGSESGVVGSLRSRVRSRRDHVHRHGFLQHRPINPLLACPRFFGEERAARLAEDLNSIWRRQGIEYRFAYSLYGNVEELRRQVENSSYDSLLVVLPESWRRGASGGDTHEQVKKRIALTSQCIFHDRTLPEYWATKNEQDFIGRDLKKYRRIQQAYEVCLDNLLVKSGWVPFAPSSPFTYNIHIGLDVGGQHNNRVMACLGYGFAQPQQGLYFRTDEIPVDVRKVEPIPTRYLFEGLLNLFEFSHTELAAVGLTADFEKVVFFRDGAFMGDGDHWNEIDALIRLKEALMARGWISPNALWTGVEVSKQAEGWRVFGFDEAVHNPAIGDVFFPFEDPNTALVCTSGEPYLTQGTACPLKVRMRDIAGKADIGRVVTDLVWQADLCFSKIDMGMSLPWVLNVADSGALQSARSYRITGIPT